MVCSVLCPLLALVLSPQYTLSNNFTTTNAYVCIELNAHALITYLMTVCETLSCRGCWGRRHVKGFSRLL